MVEKKMTRTCVLWDFYFEQVFMDFVSGWSVSESGEWLRDDKISPNLKKRFYEPKSWSRDRLFQNETILIRCMNESRDEAMFNEWVPSVSCPVLQPPPPLAS